MQTGELRFVEKKENCFASIFNLSAIDNSLETTNDTFLPFENINDRRHDNNGTSKGLDGPEMVLAMAF